MTEFRTKGKGKERQVYPIQKRKPFGVPRKLAYEDVMALRQQGKRARLIETNTRLDLYAPYESVIQDNKEEWKQAGDSHRRFQKGRDQEKSEDRRPFRAFVHKGGQNCARYGIQVR